MQIVLNKISAYKTELNISNAIVESAEEANPIGLPLAEHLFGSEEPENNYDHGETLEQGDQFPITPNDGDYFVRTDFNPNRLFVFRGSRWHRLYDNVKTDTWSDRTYNASSFINNENTTVVDNKEFAERQALSKIGTSKSDTISPGSDFE